MSIKLNGVLYLGVRYVCFSLVHFNAEAGKFIVREREGGGKCAWCSAWEELFLYI